ncbi:hypothetical protein SAY86_004867 [Trapa natans]|uniref:HD-ZIP protein N-terminal domain-containing protein n=1 Tax=Trapa natans TaxID=22666 RepID=A0AAN7MF77_TRANT|nr:hypothetical protein SAY86_004867 [Trapa natans]
MADKEDLGLSLSLSFRPHHHYHQQKVPLHLNLMPFPSITSSPSGFASSVKVLCFPSYNVDNKASPFYIPERMGAPAMEGPSSGG